jgi:hypothetical protein
VEKASRKEVSGDEWSRLPPEKRIKHLPQLPHLLPEDYKSCRRL